MSAFLFILLNNFDLIKIFDKIIAWNIVLTH